MSDLSVAIRNLVRRPGFAITSVLLLALAAGANAAVFSVVRGVLLRPLPYKDPGQLVALWPDKFVNNEELTYLPDRTRSFQAIGAISPGWMMAFVADGFEPLKVTGGRTSDNFFTTLGGPWPARRDRQRTRRRDRRDRRRRARCEVHVAGAARDPRDVSSPGADIHVSNGLRASEHG